MDIESHNQTSWNQQVREGSPWTRPVSTEQISEARRGHWDIILTPIKPVPKDWFGLPLNGKKILCLASGGGQQGPILAAAGADVTVLDLSPEQLEQDKQVAERDNLELTLVLSSMVDLSAFRNSTFDMIVHPISNCFVDNILPVWKEAYRVLNPGGSLFSGFNNPILHSYDLDLEKKGILQVKYPMPYSDLKYLNPDELKEHLAKSRPLEFGHTLTDQIGGQLQAGFHIVGFYEDFWGTTEGELHDRFFPHFIATKAIKPRQ